MRNMMITLIFKATLRLERKKGWSRAAEVDSTGVSTIPPRPPVGWFLGVIFFVGKGFFERCFYAGYAV
jgi:hypothetical protein